MIYEPREDSYLLAREVNRLASGKRVLDVGCGSGIQIEAAIKSGAEKVLGVDIDSESLDYCERKGLDVLRSDLFENVSGMFDLIVFNPPYLPEDKREDLESSKATSGGVKGDEIIIRFLKAVRNYMEEEGEILLIVSSFTPLEEIERVLEGEGLMKGVVASDNFFMEGIEVWEIRKT